MVEHRSSKPYAWVRFLLLLFMVKFRWKSFQTKPNRVKSLISINCKTQKNLRQLFNIRKKHYRPYFTKNTVVNPQLQSNTNLYSYLPYFKEYNWYGYADQVFTPLHSVNMPVPSLSIKPLNFFTPAIPSKSFQTLHHHSRNLVNLKVINNNLYSLSALISHYLNRYLLHRKNIHSKKASIIIAQIVEVGHFSRRNVYLSSTQSVSLKYKAKLTDYLHNYNSNYISLNPRLALTSLPQPLDFDFSTKTQTRTTFNYSGVIHGLYSLEKLFLNLLQLIWVRSVFTKHNTSSTKHNTLLSKLLSNKSRGKINFLRRYRNTFFTVKRLTQTGLRENTNFLWQKKKLNWTSKRRSALQFFNSFTKLPLKKKYEFTQWNKGLNKDERKVETFDPFDYKNLLLAKKGLDKNNTVQSLINPVYSLIPTRLCLFYLFQPWLLNTLKDTSVFKTQVSYLFNSSNNRKGLAYTNLQPHSCFRYIVLKKILSLFSTNKIREDVIPLYYNTLIRFMEHCSGKKIFIQLYPFLNQNIAYDYIARYKAWITRMKSYERRLGHKFFFEEALHIMHLSFTLRDSVLFSSWLKAMILRISFWKTRTIFRFLRYLFLIYFVHIFPELQIKGLKIRLKGKISAAGNSRKRTILYRVGQTSHSELNLRVSHSKQTINTFTGVMGFQVWLFY